MLHDILLLASLTISWLGAVNSEVITIGARDPRIVFDQYFHLDTETPGCNANYWSRDVGATASFNFTGTALSIIGSTDAAGGVYDVFVDSVLEDTVDRYANSVKSNCGLIMFEKTNMNYADHFLRMIFRRNSTQMPDGYSGGLIDIFEIRYTVPDVTTTLSTIRTFASAADPTNSVNSNSIADDPTVGRKKKTPTGAIAGGVVGGIAALGLIAALIWFFVLRKRTRDDNSQFSPDLGGGGEKGHIATPYNPPSNAISSVPPAAYRTMSPAPGYQTEPFSWEGASTVVGSREDRSSIANSSVRPLIQPARTSSAGDSYSVIYPPEKSPSLQPPSPFSAVSADESLMRASTSASPRVAALPLLEEDVQRIARAMLAEASGGRAGSVPPGYR